MAMLNAEQLPAPDEREAFSGAGRRDVARRAQALAAASIGAIALSAMAAAQTQIYSVTVPRSTTGGEQIVSVPGYTGTAPLTSVTVTLHVCTSRQYGVENLHPTDPMLGGEFFEDTSTFAVSLSPGATDILAMTSATFPDTVIIPGHVFDGAVDFSGISGVKAPPISRIVTAVQVSTPAESAFKGDSIPLYVSSQAISPFQTLGGANIAALHISLYSAMVTVQYN